MSRMKREPVDIVIAGGGMIGSACALALARKGFSVALVDRQAPQALHSDDAPELRVSALSRASERLLRNLGAWDAIASVRVSPYCRMHVWDKGNGVHFDAADLADDLDEPVLGHIVENRLIQHSLWQRLEAEANTALIHPDAVVDALADDNGIDVRLESGARLRARLLVAADGATSPLREKFGIRVSAADYHQRGIVSVIRTEKAHDETAYQHFLPTGPLAFLPLSDGSISIVWSADEEEANRLLALDDTEFRSALTAASDGILGGVIECGPRAAFPLRRQHAETYVADRAVLIGDAAHVVHPLAGQGANLGFMDAATLADVLAEAREAGRDFAQTRVLRRYERRRRGDNVATMWAMEGFYRLFGNDDRFLSRLRNTGFRIFDRSGPIKREVMRQAMGLRGDLPTLAR